MTPARTRRVLLLGGTGQLGQALRRLAPEDWALHAPSSAAVPLDDAACLEGEVERVDPHLIINAAAYTRVDDAEADEAGAMRINRDAPATLARLSAARACRLLHISTDYVFDGRAAPYAVDAETAPVNVYGRSKRDGETQVLHRDPRALIVRTSWVHSGGGTNFVGTVVRLLTRGTSMRVVDDQIAAPTSADTLAEAVMRCAAREELSGIEHVTDSGVASWYDVACCVVDTLREAGVLSDGVGVTPVDSEQFPRPAHRPRISLLDTHATRARLGWTPPHWRVGVIRSTTEWLARERAEGRVHG